MERGRQLERCLFAVPLSALLLFAADPSWQSKPAAQWTEADAKQILTASPWVKEILAGVAGRKSEDELREGGQMGQPKGPGYDNIDPKGSGPKLPTNPKAIFVPNGSDRSARSKDGALPVKLVWESAFPVRAAELKSHEIDPPTLAGDGYRIAVYGVPNGNFKGDPKKLGDPLKAEAALKRKGRPDVKPVRVEVFPLAESTVVVYLFPLSAELSAKDLQVTFSAHIGRLAILQPFHLAEMEYMGKLEL